MLRNVIDGVRLIVAIIRVRLSTLDLGDEGGYSTEAVVITSLLLALAIAAVGIIAAKVLGTAHSIQTQ